MTRRIWHCIKSHLRPYSTHPFITIIITIIIFVCFNQIIHLEWFFILILMILWLLLIIIVILVLLSSSSHFNSWAKWCYHKYDQSSCGQVRPIWKDYWQNCNFLVFCVYLMCKTNLVLFWQLVRQHYFAAISSQNAGLWLAQKVSKCVNGSIQGKFKLVNVGSNWWMLDIVCFVLFLFSFSKFPFHLPCERNQKPVAYFIFVYQYWYNIWTSVNAQLHLIMKDILMTERISLIN